VGILWTENALNTYIDNVDFILQNWTLKEAEKFGKLVEGLLNNIVLNNQLCPKSKLLNYRKCLVSKQTSLVYTIVEKNIVLIAFLDNRALNTQY
jgi:plasmid stabilization system protein ParE